MQEGPSSEQVRFLNEMPSSVCGRFEREDFLQHEGPPGGRTSSQGIFPVAMDFHGAGGDSWNRSQNNVGLKRKVIPTFREATGL